MHRTTWAESRKKEGRSGIYIENASIHVLVMFPADGILTRNGSYVEAAISLGAGHTNSLSMLRSEARCTTDDLWCGSSQALHNVGSLGARAMRVPSSITAVLVNLWLVVHNLGREIALSFATYCPTTLNTCQCTRTPRLYNLYASSKAPRLALPRPVVSLRKNSLRARRHRS